MSALFDAVGPSSNGASINSVSSVSWTHTPVGTPTAVGGALGGFGVVSGATITSWTYGSSNLAQAGNSPASGNGDINTIWGAAGIPSGAQTVSLSMTAGPFARAWSVTATGSDTGTCFDHVSAGANGAGLIAADAACTSQTGDLVLGFASWDGGNSESGATISAGSGQTLRGSRAGSPATGQAYAVSTAPGAASVTMSSSTTISNSWTIISASFKAAAGGTDGNAPGATITSNSSVVAGSATGGASISAQTLSDNTTIVQGSTTGDASTSSQTLSDNTTIIQGSASGAASTSAQTLSDSVTIIQGAATGAAACGGVTLDGSCEIVSAVATGAAAATGDTIVAQTSIVAGAATGTAIAKRAPQPGIGGTASGGRRRRLSTRDNFRRELRREIMVSGFAPGATVEARAQLIASQAIAGAVVRGSVLSSRTQVLPGSARGQDNFALDNDFLLRMS